MLVLEVWSFVAWSVSIMASVLVQKIHWASETWFIGWLLCDELISRAQLNFFRPAWPRSGQKGMKGYESGDFGGDSV